MQLVALVALGVGMVWIEAAGMTLTCLAIPSAPASHLCEDGIITAEPRGSPVIQCWPQHFWCTALEGRGRFLPQGVKQHRGVLPNGHPIRDALPWLLARSRAGMGQGILLGVSCPHVPAIPHRGP